MSRTRNNKAKELIYYVYIYLDENYIPFYIGKGHRERFKIHLLCKSTNNHLNNKINKVRKSTGKDPQISFYEININEEQAFFTEKYLINLYGRKDLNRGPLLNLTNGGDGSSGIIHTKKTRLLMSEKAKNKIRTEEHRRKLSQSLTGKKRTSEQNIANSERQKGKKRTPEQNKKVSQALKGHPTSIETRKKISLSLTGKKQSIETRKKSSESHTGVKQSIETCIKKSNKITELWKNPEYQFKQKIMRNQSRINKRRIKIINLLKMILNKKMNGVSNELGSILL